MNSQDMGNIENLFRGVIKQWFDDNKNELAYKIAEQVWTTRGWEHRIECPEHLKEYAIRRMIHTEVIAAMALIDRLKNLPIQEHITALKEIIQQDPDLRQYITAQL